MKLLTSERYGSIAAAATLGLPELVGGERNWDYRYCWIRDASLTAAMLLQLGFTEETLPNLSGYRGSAPLWVGNAAYDQLQLDIYGEFLYLMEMYDRRVQPVTHELWGTCASPSTG